jgi:hypothetical protein
MNRISKDIHGSIDIQHGVARELSQTSAQAKRWQESHVLGQIEATSANSHM